MPPAPLLDVVRHAARDDGDGVGDEARSLFNTSVCRVTCLFRWRLLPLHASADALPDA